MARSDYLIDTRLAMETRSGLYIKSKASSHVSCLSPSISSPSASSQATFARNNSLVDYPSFNNLHQVKMKFTTALITGLLSASTAVAAPGTAMRRKRADAAVAAQRDGALRAPKPFLAATNVSAAVHGPENKYVSYSTNWAGGVVEGSGFKTVTGTFTIPEVSLPSGGSSSTLYSASAWVGIDGYSCSSAILQTGVDFSIQNGRTTYDAWYEWFPDYAYDFSGISFSAGDSVTVTVTASSKTGGVGKSPINPPPPLFRINSFANTNPATIKNNSKGTSVSHTFSGETAGSLCQTDAEWIVEDFTQVQNGQESLVPLVDFGTVTFTGASATTNSGSSVGPASAEIIDLISANGRTVLTDVTTGSSTVTVEYE